MKQLDVMRLLLSAALAIGAASVGWGQEKQPEKQAQSSAKTATQAAGEAQAQAKDSAHAVRAGTKISAELLTAVNARTAKPGDEVAARVTKDVKQDGRKVIRKGDRLLGRIQAVEAGAAAEQGSRVAVVFDRLAQGEATSELHTVVSAILSTPREERERMAAPPPAPMERPAPSAPGSGGGGLVGGVTSTAGSAVGGTVGAVGSTVGGVGGAIDSTTQATLGAGSDTMLATPLRAIHVESQAQGESQTSANSVLSTRRGQLRLDSGTRMQFRVAAQSEAPEKEKKQ